MSDFRSSIPLLAEAGTEQISATMVLIVLVLVTVFIIYRRKPDEDEEEIPPVVTFECESCGEVLNADDAPCPMCGGRVVRMETRPETWQSGSEARNSF
jgi:hypothetical protein